MKKIIIVTGGAGFVGSNLIELLIKKTNLSLGSGEKSWEAKHETAVDPSKISQHPL